MALVLSVRSEIRSVSTSGPPNRLDFTDGLEINLVFVCGVEVDYPVRFCVVIEIDLVLYAG